MMKLKRLILKILWSICLFLGLGYGGIFFSKEIKKVEKEFKKFLENV